MANIFQNFDLSIGDIVGQELVGFDRRGLILFTGKDDGRLGDVLELIRNIPLKDPIRVGRIGKKDLLGKIVIHREIGLHQVQNFRLILFGLCRDRAFHQATERAVEVLPKGLHGLGRHAGSEVGSAADDSRAQDAVGKVEVELHGNHAANRIADQDGLLVAGCIKNGGNVRGHLGNGIPGLGLIRTPVAAMIDRNALIIPGKREGLKIPDIAVGRKRMQKHNRRP